MKTGTVVLIGAGAAAVAVALHMKGIIHIQLVDDVIDMFFVEKKLPAVLPSEKSSGSSSGGGGSVSSDKGKDLVIDNFLTPEYDDVTPPKTYGNAIDPKSGSGSSSGGGGSVSSDKGKDLVIDNFLTPEYDDVTPPPPKTYGNAIDPIVDKTAKTIKQDLTMGRVNILI